MAQVYNLEEEALRRAPLYRLRWRVQEAFENLREVLARTDDFDRVQAAIDALQEAVEQAKTNRAGN
jgi:hypothetical protein